MSTCSTHRDCAGAFYCDNVRMHAALTSSTGICVPREREVAGGCAEDRQCPMPYACDASGDCVLRAEYFSCAGGRGAGVGGSCAQWAESG